MRLSIRRALPLLGSAFCLFGYFSYATVANSVEVCVPLITTKATTATGVSVPGTAQVSLVTKDRSLLTTPISFDVKTDATGKITVCKPTDEQINKYIEIGLMFESETTNQIKFAVGDLITVLFKQASGSGSKFTYAEFALTAENVSSLNANKSINLPRVAVGSSDQFSAKLTASGIAVAGANWSLSKVTESNPWGDELLLVGETGSSGNLQLSGLPDGDYFMSFTPVKLSVPSGSSGGAMPSWGESISVASGRATFANESDGSLMLPSGTGSLRLKFKPNVGPVRDLTAAELSSIGIEFSWIFSQTGDGINQDRFSKVLADGNLVLDLPVGAYRFNTRSDLSIASTTLANTYFMAIVTEGPNGSINTAFYPSNSDTTPDDLINVAPLGSGALNIKEATVSWNYTNSSNLVDIYDQFQLFQETDESCLTAEEVLLRENRCIESSSFMLLRGRGVTNIPDGNYWFYHYPSDESGEPAGVTLLNFTLRTTGAIQKISWNEEVEGQLGNATISSDGTRVFITAPQGNVRIKVLDSSGKLFSYARSVISCYPNSSCDGSVFNAEDRLTPQTAKSGYLEGSVSQPGTYSIKITPYRNTLINSATKFEFVIGSNGKVTEVTETNGSSNYVPTLIDPLTNTWQVKLRAPTVSGRILMPGNSTAAVPWAYVGFDCARDDQVPDFGGIMADENGNFGLNFQPGWCGVEIRPNWDMRGAVTTRYNVLIEESGRTCLKTSHDQTTCESTVAAGKFDLRLAAPNVSGFVKLNNGSLPKDTYIYAEFASFGQDVRTSITSGVDSLGRFEFNAPGDGFYELRLQPYGIAGYSETIRYIKAETGEDNILRMCLASNNGGTLECLENSPPSAKLDINVNLEKANFAFNVNFDRVQIPNDLWGSMYPIDVNGYQDTQNWSERKQLNISGRSGFVAVGKLEAPRRYALEIEPSYYSTNVATLPMATKLKKYFWIGNFSGELRSCQVSFQQIAELPEVNSCIGGSTVGPTIPIQLTMTPGNVSAVVTEPDGNKVAPYASGNIRKWSTENNNWEYLNDGWFNSNSLGGFSLNLDAGIYQLVAQKGWGTSEPFVPGSQIVLVTPEKSCLKVKSYDPASDANTCSSNDVAAIDFDFRLNNANLAGTIVSESGVNVSGTWVQLYKVANSNRIFVDSTNVSKNGKFGFNVTEAGEYIVIAEPNGFMSKKSATTSESSPINVVCNDGICSHSSNDIVVNLRKPNVAGKVCVAGTAQEGCQSAGGVSVLVKSAGQVMDSATTDSNGLFTFNLDPLLVYELELKPWNGSSSGAAVTTTLALEPGIVQEEEAPFFNCSGDKLAATPSKCDEIQIELASPNVTGSLTFDGYNPMPWAWITLTSDQNVSTYGSADRLGKFSFLVDDGNYTLTAYTNSTIANKAPLTLNVIVENGTVKKWDYASRSTLAELAISVSANTGPIAADFDFVQPNVAISLVEGTCTGKRLALIEHATEKDRTVILEAGVLSLIALTEGESYDITVLPNVDDLSISGNHQQILVDLSAAERLNVDFVIGCT